MKQTKYILRLYKKSKPIFKEGFALYLCFLLVIISFIACDDADKFYGKLNIQPEVLNNYNAVYAVGDTLTIQGRLNPNNDLQIHIGEVKAGIVDIKTINFSPNSPYTVESVKMLITEEMGIGENRPVTITSAGITITAPSIEIVGDANIGILPHQLQLQKVADIPSGASPIYCRSNNGHVYLLNKNTHTVNLVMPDGSIKQVFDLSVCRDEDGTSFDVTEINAMGVDPQEKYLYMSLYTKAPWGSYWNYYRFCRWNFQNQNFEILNKTPEHIYRSQRTLNVAQPFEGAVNEVKIYKITAIYPDNQGNVYCDLMTHFMTKLDAAGKYSYLLNITQTQSSSPATEDVFVPLINNPETNQYYSSVWIHQSFPGNKINYGISYMDLNIQKAYTRIISSYEGNSLMVTDMNTLIQTGKYAQNSFDMDGLGIPYVTASLNNFNGAFVSDMDPLPVDGKLIGLYFLELENTESSTYKNFYEPYELPTLCEIDMEGNSSKRYAPRKLVMNGYTIKDDQFLNIDENGMLYMTANSKNIITKTAIYHE